MPTDLATAAERLRTFALSLPEAYEETPWGHQAWKVKKKVFCFFGADDQELSLSTKLPISGAMALQETFASPTAYGLGKSGWVSSAFDKGQSIPVELLLGWIEESYRAMAPKKLVKQLDLGHRAAAKPPTKAPADPALAIVSGDLKRVERAIAALAERGHGAIGVGLDQAQALIDAAPDLVVVDFGRTPNDALLLAQEVATYAEIVAVGLRDASWERKVKDGVRTVGRFREPPGDPAVADFVAERRSHVSTRQQSR